MQRYVALAVVAGLTLTACGSDGGSPTTDEGIRTVDVTMDDNRFQPAQIGAAPGETVRFVFRNDGAVRHEAVFGSLDEQLDHHAEMAQRGHDAHGATSGGHDADGPHAVSVEPGSTAEITHTFDELGTTVVGCHEPGHWEAGMRLDIGVG